MDADFGVLLLVVYCCACSSVLLEWVLLFSLASCVGSFIQQAHLSGNETATVTRVTVSATILMMPAAVIRIRRTFVEKSQ